MAAIINVKRFPEPFELGDIVKIGRVDEDLFEVVAITRKDAQVFGYTDDLKGAIMMFTDKDKNLQEVDDAVQ